MTGLYSGREAFFRMVSRRRGRAPASRPAGGGWILGWVLGLLIVGVSLLGPAKPAEAQAAGFSDVGPTQPYYAAVMDLAARGVVAGFPDGTFRPGGTITRQQFAKMVVKALGLPVTGTEVCPFTDVAARLGADPLYPSKYVAVCAAKGITVGKTATTFAPGDTITRQQLISMVARGAGLPVPPAAYTPGFLRSQFSLEEHYENARRAAYSWLLHGLTGMGETYDFAGPCTRGECVQILYELQQEALPAGATLLFADDFTTKWAGRLEEDNGTNVWAYDTALGEYTCSIFTAKLQSRQATTEEYQDFTVEVDARCTTAAEGGYGLVFRISPAWEEFYEFIVSNQGYWQLWHKAGSSWEPVTADRDNVSTAIAQGDAWNHLAVTAQGGEVTVWVNQVELFTLSGAKAAGGRIGLLAAAFGSTGHVTVAFDNYRVWSPPVSADGPRTGGG